MQNWKNGWNSIAKKSLSQRVKQYAMRLSNIWTKNKSVAPRQSSNRLSPIPLAYRRFGKSILSFLLYKSQYEFLGEMIFMQTEKLLKEISALNDMIGVIAERFDGADRIIDAMLREMMVATHDMEDILGVQA